MGDVKMSECDGCGIDTDTEGHVTVSKFDGEINYDLCGYCITKVEEFIKKELP